MIAKRPGTAFLLALAVYFALHALLRIGAGGALEVDEAEMILLAQDWRLGYGPQLPLYNWLQRAAFDVFGVTTAGLALLKNAVLWFAYAGLFLGLRRVAPLGHAVVATLALAFLPNVMWEFQRASTHSIALLAAVTWTIATFLALIQGGRMRDYAVFGLVLGLGGLTKANFWLVPLTLTMAYYTLSQRPAALQLRGTVVAVLIAGAIVALPYLWAIQHPTLSLASGSKFFKHDTDDSALYEGLSEIAEGTAAGLLLVIVAAAALYLNGYRRAAAAPSQSWPGHLLLRAGLIGLVMALITAMALQVAEVESRWLVPLFCLIAPGLFLLALRGTTARAQRVLGYVAMGLGVVTLAGMAELRMNGDATGRIDFEPLVQQIDAMAPDTVMASYHVGGNLRFLRPDLTVLPPLSSAPQTTPQTVLLLAEKTPETPDIDMFYAQRGLAPPNAPIRQRQGRIELPYATASKDTIIVSYLLLGVLQP